MGQFGELWMYCKEAFEVIKKRLVLFVPRLLLGGLFLGLIVLGFGGCWYSDYDACDKRILERVEGGDLSFGGLNVNFNMPGLKIPGMDAGKLLGVAAAAALVSTAITVYLDQLIFVIYARRENLV